MSDCDAILLAAGSSKRLGFDKVLTPLAGKPAYYYSLQALVDAPSIKKIFLVTKSSSIETLGKAAKAYDKNIVVLEGGKERQDSVSNGLRHVQSKYVLIHDAARPLLTVDIVEKLLSEAKKKGSAICAQRATDTIKQTADDSVKTLDRSQIWLMQTPQVFKRELIIEAYEYVQKNKMPITDDASAVEILGKSIHLVDPQTFNLKITRDHDWQLLNLLLLQDTLKELRAAVHKVSNRISPLVGYIPLLEKYACDDPKFKEYFNKIKSSTNELQEHIQNLQNLARQACPESEE
jgi:2-C-methyl-D-erythritol 4-phosphate cytidylyltransferase